MEHRTHHSSHQMHKKSSFATRFFVCLVLSLVLFIVMALSSGSSFVSFSIVTIIFLYGGQPFFSGMYRELSQKMPGMMTLVSLALIISYTYSAAVFFGFHGQLFFVELVTLIDVMLLGHWLEMRSVTATTSAVEQLSKLLPAQAHLFVSEDTVKSIKTSDLEKGMKVVVKPGEKIPGDGIILNGESEVNEAHLTGEAVPRYKKISDTVIAGSLNGMGTLLIEVTKNQHENYIAQVIHLVQGVLASKSPAQDISDRAAFYLTVIALIGGIATGVGWLLITGNLAFALEKLVTVMVTACPHALGLAVPLVILTSAAIAARNGLLIKNRKAFESAYMLDAVVFDKTGTLTYGAFEVTDSIPLGSFDEKLLLLLADSTERYGKHAIAEALKRKVAQDKIQLLGQSMTVEKGVTIPGKGVKAFLKGKPVLVGNRLLLEEAGMILDEHATKIAQELMNEGKTLTYVAYDSTLQGIIAFSDMIRKESYEAVKLLKKKGLQVILITGDTEVNAHLVAQKLEIEKVYAQILPSLKAHMITELRASGLRVAMVGDGINDAPALAAADVALAIGAGTDVALAAADIVLVHDNPLDVVKVIDLSQATSHKIRQNIFWATGYNVFALPLAAGLLTPWGIDFSPALGALFMSLSTLIVAINARTLRF